MKTLSRINLMLITALWISTLIFGQETAAPAKITAALLVKVVGYEKHISTAGDLTVFVLGDEAVAKELQKGVGQKIGKSVLKNVAFGDELPQTVPNILFVGEKAELDSTLIYTRENHILSVTGTPVQVAGGVTLGFGVSTDGKPKILLNLSSSVEEGLDWNPAIMKVAKTLK